MRAARQRIAIESELGIALGAADAEPSRAAIESFAATAASLSWSDVRVAPRLNEELTTLQELAPASPPDACADMKAWAASGYSRLSPASKALTERLTARLEQGPDQPSLGTLLKRYEGTAERALVKKTEALSVRVAEASGGGLDSYYRLERALGVPETPFEKQQRAPVLGRGTAYSGARFTVRPEISTHESGCHPAVVVELAEKKRKGGFASLGSSSSDSVCLGRGKPLQPADTCEDTGETSINAAVPATVRRVQLRLSDGSTVTSGVVRIARKYGGPAGVYVQAVKENGRRLLSLTELDAQGRTVRVVRLRIPICKREHSKPIGPKFFKLVQGTTPGGTPFTIEGSLVEFPGHPSSFSVSAEAGGPTIGSGSREAESAESTIAVGKPGSSPPKPPPLRRLTACPPHAFAVVYGLLPPPGDSVLARTPEGLVPLAKQALDPSLHAEGPLVYGAFAALPSELIVRRADGSTLYTESLAAKAKETAEFCEGLAEP